jgi:hypothetical protein
MTELTKQYTADKDDVVLDDDYEAEQHRILPCRCCGVVVNPDRQEKLRWWLLGMTTISTIFSYVAVADCSFLILDYGESNNLFNPPQLGMFSMAVFDESGKAFGCVPQNGDERFKDGAFGAARAFGVIGAMLQTLVFLVTAWILFVMRPDWAVQSWKMLQCLFVVALFCQLLMFSAFGSSVCEVSKEQTFGSDQPIQSDCSAGAASMLAAVNVVLLIGLTVLVCMVPAPIHPYFIRWSDDDDDVGTDDQVDDLLGDGNDDHRGRKFGDDDNHDDDHSDRELGNGKNYWSSDDDAAHSDDSDVYGHNDNEPRSDNDIEKPRKKKKKKSKKKKKQDDTSEIETSVVDA